MTAALVTPTATMWYDYAGNIRENAVGEILPPLPPGPPFFIGEFRSGLSNRRKRHPIYDKAGKI
jgi:hypothetical protein